MQQRARAGASKFPTGFQMPPQSLFPSPCLHVTSVFLPFFLFSPLLRPFLLLASLKELP